MVCYHSCANQHKPTWNVPIIVISESLIFSVALIWIVPTADVHISCWSWRFPRLYTIFDLFCPFHKSGLSSAPCGTSTNVSYRIAFRAHFIRRIIHRCHCISLFLLTYWRPVEKMCSVVMTEVLLRYRSNQTSRTQANKHNLCPSKSAVFLCESQ